MRAFIFNAGGWRRGGRGTRQYGGDRRVDRLRSMTRIRFAVGVGRVKHSEACARRVHGASQRPSDSYYHYQPFINSKWNMRAYIP